MQRLWFLAAVAPASNPALGAIYSPPLSLPPRFLSLYAVLSNKGQKYTLNKLKNGCICCLDDEWSDLRDEDDECSKLTGLPEAVK